MVVGVGEALKKGRRRRVVGEGLSKSVAGGKTGATSTYIVSMKQTSKELFISYSSTMGRDKDDPRWQYGTSVEGTKNSVQYNFRGKISTAGITRHKHHLVGVDRNIKKCKRVPDDVSQMFKELFEKRRKRKNVSNNVLAGKLVEEKYPHIYWTPCAAHCIDLMLEDIFKLSHLKKALERAILVNTYIYNWTLLLNMMQDFTGKRDMVRPAKTWFATAFITLNCFWTHKKSLRKMFTFEKKFAKEAGGRQTANTILLPNFWKNIDIAVKVGLPLLGVLRLIDGERKPPMGYIYEAMDRAKGCISNSFHTKVDKYEENFYNH
ncbi:hypothetical protein OSB04_016624 [Centaurea solstitialis]|uniref:DUF659 domain-containing protein n=1 Tax=Centaurea solstitialis TaxID=347529 RepID=A0AA38T2Z3_9ASTR|nr:hypothetical protein OSB04_016624 [Centaurea solstitialis]